MARLVLIEYDDAAVAQDQIIALRPLSAEARVIGVFDRPDAYCSCGAYERQENGPFRNVVRLYDQRLIVCANCLKPFPHLASIPNLMRPDQVRDPARVQTAHRTYLLFPTSLNLHRLP